MKKVLLVLVVAAIFAVSGCGEKKGTTEEVQTENVQVEVTTEAAIEQEVVTGQAITTIAEDVALQTEKKAPETPAEIEAQQAEEGKIADKKDELRDAFKKKEVNQEK